MPKRDDATTKKVDYSEYGVVRGATRYDPAEWDAFERYCEAHSLVPGTFIKKMVRDVIAGRMVALGGLKPEALAELKKYSDDLGVELYAGVERILTDFLVEHRRSRSRR